MALGRAADGARVVAVMRRASADGRTTRQPFAGVFHFNHRHAHGGLRLGGFLVVPVGHAVRVQQAIIGVFVVDGQQAALAVRRAKRQREVGHAVVVHAGFAAPVLRRCCWRPALKAGCLPGTPIGSPQAYSTWGIASRHMHHVIRRERQAGKAQAQRRGRGRVGGLRQLADRAASQAQRQRGAQALSRPRRSSEASRMAENAGLTRR